MREALLLDLLSQPTAPFREGHVVRVARNALKQGGVPHFLDPVGNIVVGASSRAEYARLLAERTDEPVRFFIAHMDHPGFLGLKWESPTRLAVKWHGGSPFRRLAGAKVWLADEKGWLGEGALTEVKLTDGRGRPYIDSGTVQLRASGIRARAADATRVFGGLAFRAPVWKSRGVLYTKAADDLVGCFGILSTALDLWGKGRNGSSRTKRPPLLAILTRAEEVGFIGAIGHFRLGWLAKARRPVLCVSLEASRTLPGAEIGKGPVVRLGDRQTTFDPSALAVFRDLAKKALGESFQQRVMDGGTCEGTVATANGYPTVAISVPLGNYHNQDYEGGPDAAGADGPAPEFVHTNDIEGLLALCRALMGPGLAWGDPWKKIRKTWEKRYSDARALLEPEGFREYSFTHAKTRQDRNQRIR